MDLTASCFRIKTCLTGIEQSSLLHPTVFYLTKHLFLSLDFNRFYSLFCVLFFADFIIVFRPATKNINIQKSEKASHFLVQFEILDLTASCFRIKTCLTGIAKLFTSYSSVFLTNHLSLIKFQ